MKIKIDILGELQKERFSHQQILLQKMQLAEKATGEAGKILYEQPESKGLLSQVGFKVGLQAAQQKVDAFREAQREYLFYSGEEKERIFHQSSLQTIARRYNLRLISSLLYQGIPSAEGQQQLLLLEQKLGKLALATESHSPVAMLVSDEADGLCLMFYKFSEELCYYCAGWGKPLTIDLSAHKPVRRVLNVLMPLVQALYIVVMAVIVVGLMLFAVVKGALGILIGIIGGLFVWVALTKLK